MKKIIVIGIIGILLFGCASKDHSESNIKKIMNATGSTEEQATQTSDILNKLEVGEIEVITPDEVLDDIEGQGSKAYRIANNYSNNIMLYLDANNVTICVRNADIDYYREGVFTGKLK